MYKHSVKASEKCISLKGKIKYILDINIVSEGIAKYNVKWFYFEILHFIFWFYIQLFPRDISINP